MNKKNKNRSVPIATQKPIDLKARAHSEMISAGFVPDFEPEVTNEVQILEHTGNGPLDNSDHDLRGLLWSSIDNPDSKDLDQLEYVEKLPNGNVRVLIAIANVDSFVAKGSAIDHHAYINTTSIYTGVVTFPMLPDELSFDLTSLIQDADRLAIVVDLTINNSGAAVTSNVYHAIVRNRAKLDYISVGQWLEDGDDAPEKIASIPGLSEQLILQNKIKEDIHNLRNQQGSLHLHTIEANPVAVDGQVIDLEEVEENPARDLIENFMIAGNIAISHFLEAKNFPSIRRVVKTPEKWPRIVEVAATFGVTLPSEPDAKALSAFLLKRKAADPISFPDLSLTIVKLLGRGEYIVEVPGQPDLGHFALAVHDYTHATAPNRRYADLVTQRLTKAAIDNRSTPYTIDELNTIALQCTQREDAAKKVERQMRKVAAAVLLSKRIGDTFDGIVTGVTSGGVFVRLFKPPAEGRIVEGEHGLDVGDKVKLRLISTDPEQAFVDFARVTNKKR